jgi:hypothetical protein
MAQPDPRDAEFISAFCSAVTGLMWAVHRGDGPAVMGQVAALVNTIIEHNKTLGDRPCDEPLRRAVAALSAGGQYSPAEAE